MVKVVFATTTTTNASFPLVVDGFLPTFDFVLFLSGGHAPSR